MSHLYLLPWGYNAQQNSSCFCHYDRGACSVRAFFAQGRPPNLGGTWRCAPDPSSCQLGGQTFTVTQSGNNLDIKNDKGDVGHAQLTSNISLSASAPWNMLGVILAEGAIQWSNGTKW